MIGYVDARHGASGISLLAALVDAGADIDEVSLHLRAITADPVKIRAEETVVDGLRTVRIHVAGLDARVATGPAELLDLIRNARLPSRVNDLATEVYRRLAAAEARVHGVEPEAVRFEELAALRSVVGVLGTALALEQLGIEGIAVSALPFGGGDVDTHHGPLPLPAPVTLELLRGIPVEPQTEPGERLTPTGAAILAVTASTFGPIPPLVVDSVGIGSAALPSPAGASIVTRVVVGRPTT